jgi:hypothetical protein
LLRLVIQFDERKEPVQQQRLRLVAVDFDPHSTADQLGAAARQVERQLRRAVVR